MKYGGERGPRVEVNEHSLFGDARCGCRLSQPRQPECEGEEKGTGTER